MLEFYDNFIDKYIDRSDFELLEMDTDSNYFAFSEDSIEKLIRPEMREEYENYKYNFLHSESKELHPTFQVDGVRFTWAQYDKRKPGLFKVETTKDKRISFCSKMYCALLRRYYFLRLIVKSKHNVLHFGMMIRNYV